MPSPDDYQGYIDLIALERERQAKEWADWHDEITAIDCPWCGADLREVRYGAFGTGPCTHDQVYEAHAPDCPAFQAEQEGGAS